MFAVVAIVAAGQDRLQINIHRKTIPVVRVCTRDNDQKGTRGESRAISDHSHGATPVSALLSVTVFLNQSRESSSRGCYSQLVPCSVACVSGVGGFVWSDTPFRGRPWNRGGSGYRRLADGSAAAIGCPRGRVGGTTSRWMKVKTKRTATRGDERMRIHCVENVRSCETQTP